jgi:4-amino-4-deoxy-L-arabinose transferase-like glycosyltransferase
MASRVLQTLLARLTPLTILAVAAALRLAWIAVCPNEPNSDQRTYHAAAVALAGGQGFRDKAGQLTDYHPVGYPALIAGFYRMFGPDPSSAFIANLLLGLLSVGALYLLARELFDRQVARLAALAFAVYPTYVMYSTLLATENAYLPATLLGLWLAVRAARAERWLPLALLTGVALAVAILVRANGLLFVPVAGIALALRGQGLRTALGRGAVMVAVAGLLLLPWAHRNQQTFGRMTALSLNGGVNFYMGNHAGGDGRYRPPPPEYMALPEATRDRTLMAMSLHYVEQNPLRYAQLCVLRTIATLRSDTSALRWNDIGVAKGLGRGWLRPLKMGCSLLHALLLGLFAAALVRGLLRREWSRSDAIVLAALLASAAPFVFIVASDRYHLPFTPFVMLWAAALWLRGRGAGASVDAAPSLN